MVLQRKEGWEAGATKAFGCYKLSQSDQGVLWGNRDLTANFNKKQVFWIYKFLMPKPPNVFGLQTFFQAIRH